MRIFAALLGLCVAPLALVSQGALPSSSGQEPRPSAPAQQAPSDSSKTAAAAPAAKIDPAKEAAIRKLLATMNMESIIQQVVTSTMAATRPAVMSSLPPGEYREKLVDLFFQRFQSKFKAQLVLELAIPIYDKYYTKEEIEGITQFYLTPLGSKVLTTLPKVVSESQAAGQKLGETLGRESMLEVLAEHPELEKALGDAAAAARKQ